MSLTMLLLLRKIYVHFLKNYKFSNMIKCKVVFFPHFCDVIQMVIIHKKI
jgi:hypothetical protein